MLRLPQGLAQDHGHAVPLRHRRIVEDDQRFDLLVSGMGLIEDADCFLLGHGGPVQDGLYLSGVLGGFFWVDLHLPQHRAVVCNHSLGLAMLQRSQSFRLLRGQDSGSDQKITFRRLGIGLTIFTSIHVCITGWDKGRLFRGGVDRLRRIAGHSSQVS